MRTRIGAGVRVVKVCYMSATGVHMSRAAHAPPVDANVTVVYLVSRLLARYIEAYCARVAPCEWPVSSSAWPVDGIRSAVSSTWQVVCSIHTRWI